MLVILQLRIIVQTSISGVNGNLPKWLPMCWHFVSSSLFLCTSSDILEFGKQTQASQKLCQLEGEMSSPIRGV